MAGETKDGLSTALETVGIGDPPADESEQLSLIESADDETLEIQLGGDT